MHPLPFLGRLRHLPAQCFLRTRSNWPWQRSSLTLLQLGESKADMEAVTRAMMETRAWPRRRTGFRGVTLCEENNTPIRFNTLSQASQQHQLQYLHVPPYGVYANRVLPSFRPAIAIPPLPPSQWFPSHSMPSSVAFLSTTTLQAAGRPVVPNFSLQRLSNRSAPPRMDLIYILGGLSISISPCAESCTLLSMKLANHLKLELARFG